MRVVEAIIEGGRGMWSPLFTGKESDKLHSAVSRVVNMLKEPDEAWFPKGFQNGSGDATYFTMANGMAGIGVFFTYCYLALKDEEHARTAGVYLDLALDAIENTPMQTSLFGGLTGICWLTEYDRRSGVGEVPDDLMNRVDSLLVKSLHPQSWNGHYDLVSGLVGMGVYALQRLPRQSAERKLWQVIHKLEEWSKETHGGTAWFTPARMLHRVRLKGAPEGQYDLGLAHGASGVISLLAQALKTGIEDELVEKLLRGAVAWLLDQRLPEGRKSMFPTLIAPGQPIMDGTLAWCYGDLCVAVALFHAGRALRERDWEKIALQTVHHATAQTQEASETRTSAALCHGYAGIAHVFNRFYQAAGDEACRDAARWWFLKALDEQRGDDEGIAGFISSLPDPDNQTVNTWPNNPSLLNGAAGIAAAMLAAVSDIEPEWDSLFLLNLPPD